MLVATFVWARAAAADDTPPIEDDETFQEELGAMPRAALQPEWIVYGAGEDRDRPISAGGGGFNLACSPEHPKSFQILNLYVGALFGSFGDERHQYVHFQTGTKPRLQFWESQPIGLYLSPRVLYTLSQLDSPEAGIAHSLSMGGAFGLSLFDGFVAGELAGEAVYALSNEFRGPTGTDSTLWKPRITTSVLFDICFLYGQQGNNSSFCRYAPHTEVSVDLTQALNALMRSFAPSAPGSRVCNAANRAVSLAPQPEDVDARCSAREVDGFLCRLQTDLAGTAHERHVSLAKQAHDALAKCYRDNRVAAYQASKNGWMLRKRLQYGPYPPELRRAMGCEADAQPVTPLSDEKARAALTAACEACPKACEPLVARFLTTP